MSISGSARTGFVALATAICALGMAMLIAGCQTKAEHDAALKTALNTYYSGHQDCLWSNPVKFPESADTRKADQLKEFDALVDAGLLQRTGGTEARHARHEERRSEYALSDIGEAGLDGGSGALGVWELLLRSSTGERHRELLEGEHRQLLSMT